MSHTLLERPRPIGTTEPPVADVRTAVAVASAVQTARRPSRVGRAWRGVRTVVRGMLRLVPGLAIALMGLGLTVSFGVFSFIGMPLLAIGLGLLTANLPEG